MILNPSNQTQLIGHDYLLLTLKNLFDDNKLPNKILFSGQKGIGKCTLSYHLSNYILSKKEDFSYDLQKFEINKNNKSYILVNNNTHPNFYLINLKEDKKNIEISQIRDMISFTNKSSFDNEHKIIVIDNLEHLNSSSTNALLKTIEEPNDKVLFFLIHDNQKKIFNTLKSRCIQFRVYLEKKTKNKILSSLVDNNFYNKLNNDFKHYYNTPGDYVSLYNHISNLKINFKDISIEEFIKNIINDNSFKKNTYIKDNLIKFIELFFLKKINNHKSKKNIYSQYSFFINKFHDVKKYNLNIESFLIEFNSKMANE
jgi:DNA polymerase-3 subunit delta'